MAIRVREKELLIHTQARRAVRQFPVIKRQCQQRVNGDIKMHGAVVQGTPQKVYLAFMMLFHIQEKEGGFETKNVM